MNAAPSAASVHDDATIMHTYIQHCDATELENRNACLDTVTKTLTPLDNSYRLYQC